MNRRLLRSSVGAVGLSLVVFALPAASKKSPVPLCRDGRFLVRGDALVAGDYVGTREPVSIGGAQVSIGNACSAVAVKLKASKRGTTIVSAKWGACTGLNGKVKLKATIDPSCSAM